MRTKPQTINRAEFVRRIAADAGVNPHVVGDVLSALIGVVLIGVVLISTDAGERVRIDGFGVWDAPLKPARVGRNPRTGAPVAIPARRTLRFRPVVVPRIGREEE